MKALGLTAALALLLPCSAAAEVVLRAITWQVSSRAEAGAARFKTVERWVQPATAKLTARPRPVITLVNRGPKAAEGIVLRYTVSARLAKIGQEGTEGVWAVPFQLNERRVPRVGANQTKDIPLNDIVFNVFLKKAHRAGYWPDALKIQVMVEPRAGEGLADRILEQTLPVVAR